MSELSIYSRMYASPELREILGRMRKLDKDGNIKDAIRQGTSFLARKLRQRLKAGLSTDPADVKQQTGNLLHSIRGKVKRNKAGGLVGFSYTGRWKTGSSGNHAHLVDRGTDRRETQAGYNRGRGGHGKNSHSHVLGFYTITRNNDTDEALHKIEEGLNTAFYNIMNGTK